MVAATSQGSAARPNASPAASRSSSSAEAVLSRNLCRAMLGWRAQHSQSHYAAAKAGVMALLTITPPCGASRK